MQFVIEINNDPEGPYAEDRMDWTFTVEAESQLEAERVAEKAEIWLSKYQKLESRVTPLDSWFVNNLIPLERL